MCPTSSWSAILTAVMAALVASPTGCLVTGCVQAPQALPSDFSPIVQSIVTKIDEDGLLEKWVADARVHGLNPAIKASIGIETYGRIGFDGVDMDVNAEVSGTGSQFAPGTVAALTTELGSLGARTDPEAMKLREQILGLLTGQATPSMMDILERLQALEEKLLPPPE